MVRRVVVKMDVEGAEWDTLLRTPSGVFERIDQLAMEFHGIGFEHQLTVVRRLKEFFHVARVGTTSKAKVAPTHALGHPYCAFLA